MAKRDKATRARSYLIGQVLKVNPKFDPELVGQVLDEMVDRTADPARPVSVRADPAPGVAGGERG